MSLQLSLDEPLLNEVVHKAAGTSGSVYHGDFLWRALVSGSSEQARDSGTQFSEEKKLNDYSYGDVFCSLRM